jgi:hypothetical protein
MDLHGSRTAQTMSAAGLLRSRQWEEGDRVPVDKIYDSNGAVMITIEQLTQMGFGNADNPTAFFSSHISVLLALHNQVSQFRSACIVARVGAHIFSQRPSHGCILTPSLSKRSWLGHWKRTASCPNSQRDRQDWTRCFHGKTFWLSTRCGLGIRAPSQGQCLQMRPPAFCFSFKACRPRTACGIVSASSIGYRYGSPSLALNCA